jgi:hypothetical protein
MEFENLREIKQRRNPYEIFDTQINKFFPAKQQNGQNKKKKFMADLRFLEEYLCFYIDRSDVVALWLDNDAQGENI